MAQKVLKIGSSAAVTIPKKSLEMLGIRIGDTIEVDVDKDSKAVIIRSATKIDRELMNWVDSFIEEYRPALEALAKK